jgi:hypothetical protein
MLTYMNSSVQAVISTVNQYGICRPTTTPQLTAPMITVLSGLGLGAKEGR